eukprot:scaffold14195_cov65-Cyclotella_meneghiniana.AAC.5
MECQQPKDSSNGKFFEWPPSTNRILAQLFPNTTELLNSFEVHPLLSKISSSCGYRPSENSIPVIFHNSTSVSTNPFMSLVSVSDIRTILSQTPNNRPLIHGKDYRLVKKITLPPSHEMAGEEYMGMLPKESYSIQDILYNFHYRGFTLVIDKMQNRWRSVANKANELKEALGVQHVGVNFYVTPEALQDDDGNGRLTAEKQVRQGFEAHWDWMDGRKRWLVAKHPTIYLSNKDQKRKPTKEEITRLMSNHRSYAEFTLCPGDSLYIPRGFIHNASTVDFDQLNNEPMNDCSYPEGLISSQSLIDRLSGPSLHLTFGLEQGCEAFYEKSFKLFYELSDITRTLKFMQSEKMQSKEADLTFCYPNMPYPNSKPCVDEVLDVSDALQNHYQQIIQQFSSYASMNFETALQRMKLHQKKLFEESQHKEQTNKQ